MQLPGGGADGPTPGCLEPGPQGEICAHYKLDLTECNELTIHFAPVP
jgi:hypothetical protein